MNTAFTNRQSAGAIAGAIQTLVEAIQLPNTFNPGGAAFGDVDMFDSDNMVEAFRYLLISAQRVCVIVPLEEKFEIESQNMKLIVRRVQPVMLVISDRVIGDRKAALYGNATTPGADGLKELVLPAVTGQLFPNPGGVVSIPSSCTIMSVKDTEKNLPNRLAVGLIMDCKGGRLEAATTPVI